MGRSTGRPSRGAWYRSQTNSWYATIDGKAVALGVTGPDSYAAAQAAWLRALAGGQPGERPPAPPASPLALRALADRFLSDAGFRLKPNTVRIYRYDIDRLCRDGFADRPAEGITADQLTAWVRSLPVNDTTKAMTLRSVGAVFGWAVKRKLLGSNPVTGVSRPKSRGRGRSAVISDEDHAKLLAAASPFFRDVLRVLHGTGCRPGEACAITVENLDLVNGVAVLDEHKTDRTGEPRLIFVPADVAARLGELAALVKSGPLLRTKHGNPWTGRSVTYMMGKVRRTAGVRAMAYGYRHTFATSALTDGLPDSHVSALLGHSSPAVLHKHYSHLTGRARELRQALNRVRPPTPPPGDDRPEG